MRALRPRAGAAPPWRHRGGLEARQEEAHVRLEQLRDRQAVALMRLVGGVEHVIELADELAQLGGRFAHLFYRNCHASSTSHAERRLDTNKNVILRRPRACAPPS